MTFQTQEKILLFGYFTSLAEQKAPTLTLLDVIPHDGDVIVSVRSGLLVIETKGVSCDETKSTT